MGEVSVGVAVGIMIADGFTHLFDRGSWQIVVTTLLPLDQSGSRIVDALIGGGVGLLAATIVPGAPLRRPREEAAKVTHELARLLRAARQSALDVSTEKAEVTLSRARETEGLLDDLRAAANEGIEVVRSSPFRRRYRGQVRSIADVVGPLDRALRNTRVLARRVLVSARLDETMPEDYLRLLEELAEAVELMAGDLAANEAPSSAAPKLVAPGEETARASEPLTLSAAVVLGQIRPLVIDLLELSGMAYSDAISAAPNRP